MALRMRLSGVLAVLFVAGCSTLGAKTHNEASGSVGGDATPKKAEEQPKTWAEKSGSNSQRARVFDNKEPAPPAAGDTTRESIFSNTAHAASLMEPNPSSSNSEPARTSKVDLTPFSTYADEWRDAPKGESVSFSDMYTRLLVVGDIWADGKKVSDTNTETALAPLPYSTRLWPRRALWGIEFAINLTAKVTVGAFESTVPLVTIGYQSNSEGEHWNRVIHHSQSNFPLFLVKADGSASVPSVRFSVNGTKKFSSRGAAASVSTVLGVARAIGQPASVITRLSEQSTKDKARAVDDALSKLFDSGVNEEHWTDRDLRLWRVGAKDGDVVNNDNPKGVKITFRIPTDTDDWESATREVGSWLVTFDYPRPSIFADFYVCGNVRDRPFCKKSRAEAETAVHQQVSPGAVLNYVLVDGNQGLGTIRAYLSQQDWYNAAQALLVNKDSAAPTASALCQRITNEITGLGLNWFDAQIVVWAVAKGMPFPAGTPDFSAVDNCKGAIEKVTTAKALNN